MVKKKQSIKKKTFTKTLKMNRDLFLKQRNFLGRRKLALNFAPSEMNPFVSLGA